MATRKAIIFDKDGTLFDFGASWGPWAEAVLSEIESLVPGVSEDEGFSHYPVHVAKDEKPIAGGVEEISMKVSYPILQEIGRLIPH